MQYSLTTTPVDNQLRVITPNWRAYCANFAQTLNMQEARDASGLSVGLIKTHGNDTIVQEEIARNMEDIISIARVDKGMLLRKLYAFLESDIVDIYYDDGRFRPLYEWPKIMRQMIVSFEMCPVLNVPIKVKFIDRMRVIELLGKHVDVAAFEEKIVHQHELGDKLAERLATGRERMTGGLTIEHSIN